MTEKMKNHSKIYVYDVEYNKIDKKTKQNKKTTTNDLERRRDT
jgi:hypothetical protein